MTRHALWFKLWMVAFLLLFFGKLYEKFYPSLEHDHGHRLKALGEREMKDNISLHQKLLKQIPQFKDDYERLDNIIYQFDQYLKFRSEFDQSFILLCKDEQLLYWNKEECYYDPNWCPCSEKNGKGFFEKESIYFFGSKSEVLLGDTKMCLIQYTPVFSEFIHDKNFQLSNERIIASQLSLKDSHNNNIGYISNTGSALSTLYSNFLLIYYLIILIFLYIPFHIFSKEFFVESNIPWGILIWFVGALMIISVSQWMVSNTEFYDSFLTKSKINTQLKNYTLFEYLVLCGLIFHLAYVFNKYYSVQPIVNISSKFAKYLIPFLNYLSIILAVVIYCSSFKSIFSNSAFEFDLERLLFMPLENYLILFCLILLLLSIFLIAHKLNLSTLSFQLAFKQRLIMQFAAFLLLSIFYHQFQLEIDLFTFIVSSVIFILLQDFFIDYKQNNILWLISWILVISFLNSGLIFHYQNVKKRVEKLSLVSSIDSISYNIIDSSGRTQSNEISQLISESVRKNLDLFIYEDDQLKYSSNFNRPDYFWAKRVLGTNLQINTQYANQEYYISKVKPNYLIISAHPIPSIVKAISLFSYLFTALIIFSYIISLLNQKYPLLPESLQFRIHERPSLRNRIQFYVILSIVISFLTIALVTVFFTRRSEQEISSENLINKMKYYAPDLERSIINLNSEDANYVIQDKIKKSITLFDYRVEYFNQKGIESSVLNSTAQEIDKLKLCDPDFYFNYNNSSETIINKYIDLEKDSRIAVLRNIFQNNQKIGTLKMSTGIAKSTSGDSRLTNLINTLLNIYVFLFLISASLATILANSITSPLTSLSNRIKMMRLGKKNELLEWSGQDEIGVLINDYNRMVEQLDESVAMLAKTERDSAWREMAKQVAHEIKNPLTPMKLNIQYLQQQIKSGNGDVNELIKNMADSLLEQIEGLTKIATEFSNFAKMPKAENERVLLNDLVISVHDLFRKRDDTDILLTIPIDEFYVFCDRNQLIRVLNNLINNAIQSIPDHTRGKIQLHLMKSKNKAIISIQDNGSGIPEEMKSKIFLPNFTTKTSGTGLGLAMCQQIIEAVNGRITFDSEINVGTTFYVHLPLMREDSDG
ncbi:MAG: HAMP domain-containing histidine kinase [Saprospiraceae bacterium]|nr:HAMP domain-containing histidine kinase [Saprospiraceae bacterium]